MQDSEDRRRRLARERAQRYRRQLAVQQRNDRRQDNTDRRRLARQQQSDTLRLLTREEDRQMASEGRSRESLPNVSFLKKYTRRAGNFFYFSTSLRHLRLVSVRGTLCACVCGVSAVANFYPYCFCQFYLNICVLWPR